MTAVMAHPIPIKRPIVVRPKSVRLWRTCELVLDLLPTQQRQAG
ncbi:hypothetical protein [Bradyrhizobium sp. 139]